MYPIPGYMVLALKHMSANGISGIRPLDVLRGSLDYDAEVKEISLNQLDGINHGVMLEVPGQALDETRKAQIVADFLDAYESSGQRVLVLEGGIKATTFNQSPVDAQLMDVEYASRATASPRSTICRRTCWAITATRASARQSSKCRSFCS